MWVGMVKRDDTGMEIHWNAARHGESAQQQQTWNKLHFKRMIGYVLG
jgi:hypothetical protein